MTIFGKQNRSAASSTSVDFRGAMREFASAVSVVTAGHESEWAGITTTSIASLSLDPPRILICINRSASVVPFLERYWHFAVSFLNSEQHDLAQRFADADAFHGIDRFRTGHWSTLTTGSPILADALAILDCKLEETIPRHSHLIVVGRVVETKIGLRQAPLIQWRENFVQAPIETA